MEGAHNAAWHRDLKNGQVKVRRKDDSDRRGGVCSGLGIGDWFKTVGMYGWELSREYGGMRMEI